MKKNQKVKLKGSSVQGTDGKFYKIISHHMQNGYLVSEALATDTVVTPGGASKYWNTVNNISVFNDCYWFRKDAFFDVCTKDDEHCVGMKKCKFYETEFQHKVREAIEKAENEKE